MSSNDIHSIIAQQPLSSAALIEAELEKRGKRSWKKRHFVLHADGYLLEYKDAAKQDDGKPHNTNGYVAATAVSKQRPHALKLTSVLCSVIDIVLLCYYDCHSIHCLCLYLFI